LALFEFFFTLAFFAILAFFAVAVFERFFGSSSMPLPPRPPICYTSQVHPSLE
jgi:tellurite resistance protein TehA-like permease